MRLHQDLDDRFGERAPPATVHDDEDLVMLTAWALWRLGGFDREAALKALTAFDGSVRLRLERLAAERRMHGAQE